MNCPDHGEVEGNTCWDCPISPYGPDGPLATCCEHRKDDHRGDGCQAAITFGDPPQGAGRCACRFMGSEIAEWFGETPIKGEHTVSDINRAEMAEKEAAMMTEVAKVDTAEVFAILGAVEETQRDIGRIVSDLGGKLAPVLRSMTEDPGVLGPEPHASRSPLGERLESLNESQRAVVAVLNDMWNRLAV